MKKSLSLDKRVRSSSGSIFRGGEDEDVDEDEDDSYRNCVNHDKKGMIMVRMKMVKFKVSKTSNFNQV